MNVFISYRRSDTQDFSGRLADRLRDAHGVGDVFLDVDEIEAGEDFERRIRNALEQSAVSLVVIGPNWCGEGTGNQARIFQPDDFVRLEVREALKSGTKVLPVLANGALMPSRARLPEELQPLTKLNAVSVRHSDFERDTDYLLDVIFARKKPGRIRAYFRRHPILRALLDSLGGAFAAFFLLVLVLAAFNVATGLSLDQVVDGTGPAILITLVVMALGAGLPIYLRMRSTRRRARG